MVETRLVDISKTERASFITTARHCLQMRFQRLCHYFSIHYAVNGKFEFLSPVVSF